MENNAKILNKYNIDLFDDKGIIKEADSIIQEIRDIWDSLSKTEKLELAHLFVTEDGHNGIII